MAPVVGPDDGIFTDGSSIPNPGPGGWAAVKVVDGKVVAEISGSSPATTNNRMELTALAEAVARLLADGEPAVIYTDSNLAVKTLNEWAHGWQRRGWVRKAGPVENLDLIRPLYESLQSKPQIEVRWIKAHAGHRWNERADELANAAARKAV